jgi:hypothetical protein
VFQRQAACLRALQLVSITKFSRSCFVATGDQGVRVRPTYPRLRTPAPALVKLASAWPRPMQTCSPTTPVLPAPSSSPLSSRGNKFSVHRRPRPISAGSRQVLLAGAHPVKLRIDSAARRSPVFHRRLPPPACVAEARPCLPRLSAT